MKALLLIACTFYMLHTRAQKPVKLTSPDGKLVFSFGVSKSGAFYNVRYNSTQLIAQSQLNLVFNDGDISKNVQLLKPVFRDTTETYDLVVGKTSHVITHYKEVLLPLQIAGKHKVDIRVKAFNDGVAFRYEFVKQQGSDSLIIKAENSSFAIAGNPTVTALQLPGYTSSHEGFYTKSSYNDLKTDTLIDMPALLQFDNAYMAITEAALLDYAGMYLMKQDGQLISKLSPLPKDTAIKVKALLPHVSPWRVMLISDRIGALIESNIITTLNAPCKIEDVSWLHPGKTTFPWWNGNVVPDTINAPGNNFVTNKYYIDFCARNNIDYHSVVEYGLHQWYMDDGVGFQPGPYADVTTPVPGLDMKEICDYAKTKGVGVRVWVHFYALYPKLDSAFAIFEKWGLQGMMVDFMDRDDQEMVNMQTEILQKAAAHHLHIQFHGAYKPTGLSRTYPNEFTREGTLNYEADKWTDTGLPPDHDINMPFTRGLAGSTDYHLGGFRAVPQDSFRAQYTRPLVLGTRCHMLAMYVVLENYLQMVCDYPEAYEGQPGFEFIQHIPTTWDETKVLDASVSKYVTIARRKGTSWYVGTINDHEARDIQIPMHFLNEGNYTATIYTDAADVSTNPNHVNKQTKQVSAKDVLTLHLAGGGGEVIVIEKQ